MVLVSEVLEKSQKEEIFFYLKKSGNEYSMFYVWQCGVNVVLGPK
jgi:hypothetical protein